MRDFPAKPVLLLAALLAFPASAEPLDLLPPALSQTSPQAVRSVPVAESFPDMRFVPPPQIGLRHELDENLWHEANIGDIAALLAEPWHFADSPALTALARHILLLPAPPPALPEGGQFWRYQLARLFDLGALGDIAAVLQRQPALLASRFMDLLRLRMALAENRLDFACALNAAAGDDLPMTPIHAAQITALCEIYARDYAAAALTARFLRENDAPAAPAQLDFLAVLNGIISGRRAVRAPQSALDENLRTVLRLDSRPVSLRAIANAHPAVLGGIASDLALAENLRAAAARRAAALGIMPVEPLRALMPPPPDNLITRARALREELISAEKLDWIALARARKPELRALPPSPSVRWFARDMVRALLINGTHRNLSRWISLLPPLVSPPPDYASAAAPRQAFLHLLNDLALPERGILALTAAEERRARIRLNQLRDALYDGIFSPRLLNDASSRRIDEHLAAASAAGRRGETALRVLMALGATSPAGAPPDVLRLCLLALRHAGFGRQAWDIAVEAAILNAP